MSAVLLSSFLCFIIQKYFKQSHCSQYSLQLQSFVCQTKIISCCPLATLMLCHLPELQMQGIVSNLTEFFHVSVKENMSVSVRRSRLPVDCKMYFFIHRIKFIVLWITFILIYTIIYLCKLVCFPFP